MNLTERLTVTGEESEEQLLAMKRLLFQEAKAQGVISGLATIARQFGKELNANYGPKYKWEGEDVVVYVDDYVDDYGNYMTVRLRGRLIVSSHPTEKLFVPGPWLTPLLPLMEQAKQAAEANAEQRKRDAAQALRNALSF
jgi:hypothetical protein